MLVSKLVGEDGGLSGGCRGLSNRLEAHFGAFWAYLRRLEAHFCAFCAFWAFWDSSTGDLSGEDGGPF